MRKAFFTIILALIIVAHCELKTDNTENKDTVLAETDSAASKDQPDNEKSVMTDKEPEDTEKAQDKSPESPITVPSQIKTPEGLGSRLKEVLTVNKLKPVESKEGSKKTENKPESLSSQQISGIHSRLDGIEGSIQNLDKRVAGLEDKHKNIKSHSHKKKIIPHKKKVVRKYVKKYVKKHRPKKSTHKNRYFKKHPQENKALVYRIHIGTFHDLKLALKRKRHIDKLGIPVTIVHLPWRYGYVYKKGEKSKETIPQEDPNGYLNYSTFGGKIYRVETRERFNMEGAVRKVNFLYSKGYEAVVFRYKPLAYLEHYPE
ncbi:MAG: hypothetical protein OEZ36_04560 [Spirochaetota bacterium]|nr:hypothetical protein [Spirochaetota bacterium]